MRINYDVFDAMMIFMWKKNVWHFIKYNILLKTQKNITLRAWLLFWIWEENRLINDKLRPNMSLKTELKNICILLKKILSIQIEIRH